MTPRAAPSRVAVVFDRLSVCFGALRALHEVSFACPAHQITALIGPSGCGKSTLLRAVNRLNDEIPSAVAQGRVLLEGEDCSARTVDVGRLRQRVGMVFQRSTPFPRSVFANVAYGPRLQGAVAGAALDQRVETALRRAALWEEVKDRLQDSAFRLSGGQQQRLCLARALANEPEVLLLDEPTSALDPQATQRIEEQLYELRGDLTIILVTHNLQQAARVADRTALLLDGQLVEVDESRRLFTTPRDPRTEAFITGRYG